MTLLSAADTLLQFFKKYGSASVALSGGADSACVLLLACRHIGSENVTAYTCTNNHIFTYEIETAKYICEKLSVRHVFFETEMPNEFYTSAETRCYHCKTAILGKISELSDSDVIFDGTNADDDPNARPGFRALEESSVISPLRLLGLGKAFASETVKSLGIKFHDESCKASRLVTITDNSLDMVEKAEDRLRNRFGGIRHRADENRIMFKKALSLYENDYEDISAVIRSLRRR